MNGYSQDELARMLLRESREAGSQVALCRRVGICPDQLSHAISGKRRPPKKLLDYFGLQKKVIKQYRYEPR